MHHWATWKKLHVAVGELKLEARGLMKRTKRGHLNIFFLSQVVLLLHTVGVKRTITQICYWTVTGVTASFPSSLLALFAAPEQ